MLFIFFKNIMVINLVLFIFYFLRFLLQLFKPLKFFFPYGYNFFFEIIQDKFEKYNKKNLMLFRSVENNTISKHPSLRSIKFKSMYFSLNITNFDNNSLKLKTAQFYVILDLLQKNNSLVKSRDLLLLNFYIQIYVSRVLTLTRLNIVNFNSLLLYFNSLDCVAFFKKKTNKSEDQNLVHKNLRNYFNLFTNVYEVSIKNPTKLWSIKFPVSFLDKLLNNSSINKLNTIFFIRNFRVFNKGRYSRNRQYYRTGVYWCLYVNIIAVVGMYYWFYRFTMNFSYLWWLFFFFFFTIVFSKFIKFNLFNVFNLKNELQLNLKWLGAIVYNLYLYTYSLSIKCNLFLFFLKTLNKRLKILTNVIALPFNLIFQLIERLFNLNSKNNIHCWDFFKFNYYLPLGWISRGHKLKYFENLYNIIRK